MCGIAGLVGHGVEVRAPLVRRMNQVQRHRGPDGEGVFVDPGVALGHVRLAVLDRSDAGQQPMSTPDGRYQIVYNGEVYNYLELRKELEHTGPFVSGTDTEVVVRAFAKWGPACLERFIGMFSLAIWDRRERRLFCARDRFGIKPFYYAEHQGAFVFASEMKALFQCGVPRRPSLPALQAYLGFGEYDHQAGTFFEGVSRLMPGHSLSVRPGQPPVVSRYYQFADHVQTQPALQEDEAAERLWELLNDAVRLRLRADVRIGVKLSGGLDSSTMLALLNGRSEIEAFTCDYADPRYSERPWVEAMGRTTGRPVTFSRLEPDAFWRSLDRVTWHEEEPFGGVMTAAWFPLYQLAKEHGVTVLLDGNGIDDILAGYRSHHAVYLRTCLQEQGEAGMQRALAGYAQAWRVSRSEALRDLQRSQAQSWTSMALDASNPLRPECAGEAVRQAGTARGAFDQPFANPLKNFMYQGLCYTKIPRALRFIERMSMARSLELRVPFLDHRVAEFCFGLPDDLMIRPGAPKYLLRRTMAGRLPDSVRLAPKRSVQSPQREWLAESLRDRIETLLERTSLGSSGILDADRVRACYRRYCQGERANSFYVWQWINLDHWYRIFIDPAAPPASSPEACEVDETDRRVMASTGRERA